MESNTKPDPVAVVESLDANALGARLDALRREAAALVVLYKAARAQERVRKALEKVSPKGGKA